MEIWKDIIGYEGLYQVSNLGRVRRLPGTVWNGRGWANKRGMVLKQSRTRGDYLAVGLSKNGEQKSHRINRLVALAFIPNPHNLLHAGHLDDDKNNNEASNLYWTDAEENNTHNGKHIRVGEKVGKPVIGTKDGEELKFKSSLDAGRSGFNSAAIRNCLSGRSRTHQGYEWRYAN